MRKDQEKFKLQKTVFLQFKNEVIHVEIPQELLFFEGNIKPVAKLIDFESALLEKIENPFGCRALRELVNTRDKVLILIDDNTRNTPVNLILPVLINYLENCGICLENIEILVALGTHRKMTNQEILDKVGTEVFKKIIITQHDFSDKSTMADLGFIQVEDIKIPVLVNKKAVDANIIIGLGNIVPHSDAGFSGGAKIVQPGICGYATTAMTHIIAALQDEICLGIVENPCRLGMEKVAALVGLNFIINVIMNCEDEVVDIVAGDFVKAHRQGAEIARNTYGVEIPGLADIVITCSFPYDVDFWQAEKGLVSAYFAVKQGGYIILVASCPEGLEHNHPKLREWVRPCFLDACKKAKTILPDNEEADLIAADVAIATARIREKADILLVSEGISKEESDILGFRKCATLQEAVDYALENIQNGKIGVLPRGADSLPFLKNKNI